MSSTLQVRSLETENSTLRFELTGWRDESGREVASLKARYEAELADARSSLDESSKERAWLQIELSRIRAEHDQVTRK